MDAVGMVHARPSMTVSVIVSAALVTTALATVVAVSASAADALSAINADAVARGDIDDEVLAGDRTAVAIAMRNLGAVGLLLAGAPMLGILTVFGVAVLGIGLGLSGAAVIAAIGPLETLARVAPYIVFELAAVMLAATAGALPTVHVVRARLLRTRVVSAPTRLRHYSDGLRVSLLLAAVAVTLIVAAAGIEAVVIAEHTT